MLYELLQHDVVLLGEIHFNQVHNDNELIIVRELVKASVVSSRKMQLCVEGPAPYNCSTPVARLVASHGFKVDASITNAVKTEDTPTGSTKYVKIWDLNEMNDMFIHNLSVLLSRGVLTVVIVGKAHVMRKNFPEIGMQQKLPKKIPHISCIAVIFDDEDEPAGIYKEGPDYRIVGRLKQ